MGLERDVNRSTAEAGADRDWPHAIGPWARLIEAHLNRDLFQGLLGETRFEVRFQGLDRSLVLVR